MIPIKNIYFLNRIGQRPQLEDTIYPFPGRASTDDRLFMVCDGVGGEKMGEEASRIACESFSQYITDHPLMNDKVSSNELKEALQYVRKQMEAFANANPEAAHMSTTLTLAYIGEKYISAAWCGDSRIYHIRKGKVLWRSEDHSLVANLVKHGEITPEEAAKHPNRNVITRSISASGQPSEIDVHYIGDIRDGDTILLCTDGLLEQITDSRLAEIVSDDNDDKAALFLRYADGLTKDNFSMYMLSLKAPLASNKRSLPGWLYIILLLTIVVAAGWEGWKYISEKHKMMPVQQHPNTPFDKPLQPPTIDSSGIPKKRTDTLAVTISGKHRQLLIEAHRQPAHTDSNHTGSPGTRLPDSSTAKIKLNTKKPNNQQ